MSFSEVFSAPITNSSAPERMNSENQNFLRSSESVSTDFLRAAKTGNLNAVLSFLRGGVDINFSINGLNAVHLASKEGHEEVVRELLKRGANVDATTKKMNTALHIASLAGQIKVVKTLLEYGADVNSQSVNGFTPLYMAAQENHVDIVKLLLANKANQNLSTEDGFTPLAVALQQEHKKVVEILLENDCKGKVRLPALHIAAKKNDTSSANLLLQFHLEPELNIRNGFTPLHIAAHYGNLEISQLLISKGADVNFPAKHNITPLHVAAKWGKDKIVRLLLQNNAHIDAKTHDGLTPLHCAARSGHEQVVDTLVEKGAPITAKTKNGLTALHMTAQGDHVDAAKVLLSYKSSIIDDVTCDYLTPLHIAAHCGHVSIARLFIDRNADISAKALNGFTPLHIACKKDHVNIVLLLLKCGASVDVTTESGLTPLHVAAFIGALSILSILIENGANQECATIRGETAIHIAARSNQIASLKCLIENGSNVNAMSSDNQTALHIATYLGNNECVLYLLRNGAEVEAITKDGYTSLHIAAKEGHCDVAVSLIENGASLVSMTKNGLTPLHVATHYNHPNIVLILLRSGCSPHDAAMNGYTPLHIAAKKNHMDIVTMLLEYNVHVDARSNGGFVPLHLACQEGYVDVVSVLIFHHADVNACSKNHLTPLHLCAQEDRVACAQLLIKHGAHIDVQTEGGYTPLHVAAHFGHVNMVKFLLQIEANLHAETKHGYTPLHCAAQQGHLAIVRILLEHGASPNKLNKNGQTPFVIAQNLGNISIIEELKSVTEVTVYNKVEISTEDRYKIQMPERLHEEQPLSDSDDESSGDMLADHSIAHMQYLHDENFSHDQEETGGLENTPKMEKRTSNAVNLSIISPVDEEVTQVRPSSTSFMSSQDVSSHLRLRGFLVSFVVNAKGAVMKGCRYSGVKVIIPPGRASCPTRITCRFVSNKKSSIEPPLSDGDTLATRVLEMRPSGYQFLGPIIIELPHFASLKNGQREVVVYRSDNGEKWVEHSPKATDQLLKQILSEISIVSEEDQEANINSSRTVSIITNDFPKYYALVSRITQDVALVDEKGTTIVSTLAPKVQVVIPEKALQKSVKVALQSLSVPNETVVEMFGSRLSVSPVVAIEPRRRKFHKPIIITIPLPKSVHKSSFNSYTSDSQSLRLLCSISGGTHPAHWEDITGHTPLTFQAEAATFTSTVSARFWLVDTQNTSNCARNAQELYREIITVPFVVYFVVYCKRSDSEIHFRVYCITDDKEEKTLEIQENFKEIARSNEVEVLDKRPIYLETDEKFEVTSKCDIPLSFMFIAFRENRLAFSVRVRDTAFDNSFGQFTFLQEKPSERAQNPICNLMLQLPEFPKTEDRRIYNAKLFPGNLASYSHSGPINDSFAKATVHLSDIARKIGDEWRSLGKALGLDSTIVESFSTSHPENPGLAMLRYWIKLGAEQANGNILEKTLRQMGREDVLVECLSDLQPVMDRNERRIAMERIQLNDNEASGVIDTTSLTEHVGDASNQFHILSNSEKQDDVDQEKKERSNVKSSKVTNVTIEADPIQQATFSEPKISSIENSIKSLANRIVHAFDSSELNGSNLTRSRIDSDQIVPQLDKSEVISEDEELKLSSWTDLAPIKDDFEVIETPVQRLAKAMTKTDVSLPNIDLSDSTQSTRLSSRSKKQTTSTRSFNPES